MKMKTQHTELKEKMVVAVFTGRYIAVNAFI